MKAIILAAGQGKRMHSQIPKVLHPILGKPLVKYVTDACYLANIEDITIVVSPGNVELMKKALPSGFHFVTQDEPKGTGHAVMAAKESIAPEDDVLVLYGDMPLITADFLITLRDFYREANADGVVTALHMPDSSDFGRVFVSSKDKLARIVEFKDLTPNDPHTDLINAGGYIFKGDALLYGLEHIDNNNNQHEYYLPDVPNVLRAADRSVKVFRSYDKTLFAGINNQYQLAEAATIMRSRINARHMANGVRMVDPATVYIDDTVQIKPEAVLYPGVILEGACVIARETVIGPNTRMVNTVIGEGSIAQYSVLEDSTVGSHTEIGPFAHLRPGSVIGDHCILGNCVEVKNSRLGDYTKARHLAYIGDAEVGKHVSYGCGSIISNYDGKNKSHTVIKDHAFIGCNVNLVAPLTIEENAYIAAGSTITEDVPGNALAIARERQTIKPDWRQKQ